MRETELRGQGRLLYGQQSAAVRYVFWRRDGSADVGNGVVMAAGDVLIDASRRRDIQLELAPDRRVAIWMDNIKRDEGEASFCTS
jgi:hypothetical protein